MSAIDEATLTRIERKHAQGLTSAEILDVFAVHGVPLSEATLRKYVQLGLLPRSGRVGKKGKHQGSQGIYPVQVIREISRIKQMMAEDYTIEQIQREVLFMSSELQQLEQTLASIFDNIEDVLDRKKQAGTQHTVGRGVGATRALRKEA